MLISLFRSISDPNGEVKDLGFYEWTEKILPHKETTSKDTWLYSPAIYSTDPKRPVRRANKNVVGMGMLVLDFDNEGVDPVDITPPVALHERLETTHTEPIPHLIHSTYSSTPAIPKYRVIVPLSDIGFIRVKDDPGRYKHALAGLYHWLGSPPGVDVSSRELSRAYYIPSCPPGKLPEAFSYRLGGPRTPLPTQFWTDLCPDTNRSVFFSPKASSRTPRTPGANHHHHATPQPENCGRNDRLKSIVSSLAFNAKPHSYTTQEVLEADLNLFSHHPLGPLFSDPREFSSPDRRVNAETFVSNIYKTIQNIPMEERNPTKINGEITTTTEEVRPEPTETTEDLYPKNKKHPFKFLFDTCPGPVGELAHYISRNVPARQPEIALAVSLAAYSALKGHQVRTASDTRSNLFLAIIAPSGTGKTVAYYKLKKILIAAELEDFIAGEPRSTAGLFSSLESNNHKKLLMWDEFGLAFSGLNKRQTPGHEIGLPREMMNIYSASAGKYHGGEYSKRGKKADDAKRVDLDFPHLTICGFTTPSTFFGGLSAGDALSGFLPRFLLLDLSHLKYKAIDLAEYKPTEVRVPSSITSSLRNAAGVNKLEGPLGPHHQPDVIQYEPAAKELYKEQLTLSDAKYAECSAQQDAEKAIIARYISHIEKVALTISQGPYITEDDFMWSCLFVTESIRCSINIVQEALSENRIEATAKRVLSIIKKAGKGGIVRSELTNKTYFLSGKERLEILTTLEEGDKIVCEIVEPTSKGGRRKYIYRTLK